MQISGCRAPGTCPCGRGRARAGRDSIPGSGSCRGRRRQLFAPYPLLRSRVTIPSTRSPRLPALAWLEVSPAGLRAGDPRKSGPRCSHHLAHRGVLAPREACGASPVRIIAPRPSAWAASRMFWMSGPGRVVLFFLHYLLVFGLGALDNGDDHRRPEGLCLNELGVPSLTEGSRRPCLAQIEASIAGQNDEAPGLGQEVIRRPHTRLKELLDDVPVTGLVVDLGDRSPRHDRLVRIHVTSVNGGVSPSPHARRRDELPGSLRPQGDPPDPRGRVRFRRPHARAARRLDPRRQGGRSPARRTSGSPPWGTPPGTCRSPALSRSCEWPPATSTNGRSTRLPTPGVELVNVHPDVRIPLTNIQRVRAANAEAIAGLGRGRRRQGHPDHGREPRPALLRGRGSRRRSSTRSPRPASTWTSATPTSGSGWGSGTGPPLLEAFGDRLAHVHLSDNRGGAEDLHLPLGAGTIDWGWAASQLRSRATTGP